MAKMSVAAEERRNFSSLLVSLSFSTQLSSPHTRPAGVHVRILGVLGSVCAATFTPPRGTDRRPTDSERARPNRKASAWK